MWAGERGLCVHDMGEQGRCLGIVWEEDSSWQPAMVMQDASLVSSFPVW